MFDRRQLLLASVSIAAFGFPRKAYTFVPIILAALAAVVALAVATGKAAEALETVVNKGERLWTVLASLPEKEAARKEIEKRQESLRTEIGIRREVVDGAHIAQTANSTFVTSVKFYLVTRDTNAWNKVAPSMNQAASALESMAAVFREKAAWFPEAAQDALAQLPKLYEARISIISDLHRLSQDSPPQTDEELNAWAQLVSAYDQLRVESLKLIRALEIYLSSS